MKRGKRICSQLKDIRRSIAEENNIPLDIPECTYEGECRGTCPRCESEVKYLESELSRRARMGFAATVAGVAVTLTACDGENRPFEVTGISPVEDTLLHIDTTQSEKAVMPKCLAKKAEMKDVPEVTGGISIEGDCIETEPVMVEDEEIWQGEETFLDPEVDPEFPGGMDSLFKFLEDNIRYPQEAMDLGIEGRVFVAFVVEEDGSVGKVIILRDIGGGCGREAVRIVKSMPKWKPAINHGKVVRSQFNLPVNFELNKE